MASTEALKEQMRGQEGKTVQKCWVPEHLSLSPV